MWFNAEKLGEFHVFCTEYCGTSHSGMITKLKVVSQEDFDKWLVSESEIGVLPLAEQGAKYFQIHACISCHNVDNPNVKIGPSLQHKFGTEENFEDGSKAMIDENYIRESMMLPQAKLVKGFPTDKAMMTSFQGQLQEKEIVGIIEYIKGLK